MYLTVVLAVLFVTCGQLSADKCDLNEFFGKFFQSVQAMQGNGQQCLCEKVDMAAVAKLMDRKIEARLRGVLGPEASCYMGMKSRGIRNDRITASSYIIPQHEPYRARLDNNPASGISTGSWSAKQNVMGQWLQVDLGSVKEVAGLITQGRPASYSQWVKTYKVSCGPNEHSLTMVHQDGQVKIYPGNSDMNTKVYNSFPQVLSCRYVRIYPLTWNNHITMRFELVAGACYDEFHL